MLAFYTGVTRSSDDILEAQRQDTRRADPTVVDSLHRTKELGYKIKEALENADLERLGRLLDEHWQSKKRRSEKISDSRLNDCYKIAKGNGALRGKIMGTVEEVFYAILCQ